MALALALLFLTDGLPGVDGRATAARSAAQDPKPEAPPSFRSQVSAITVDAVVLDTSGAPVRGLTREDFTILEDGRPQTIVGFEARDLETARSATAPVAAPLVATNERSAASSGRMLVILVDDLGLTSPTGQQVKTAVEGWLRTGPRAEDEITLLTTSGDVWWADTVGAGRADLIAVLDRLRGKREARSRSDLTMTEEEAALLEHATPTGAAPGRAGDAPAFSADPNVGPPLVGASDSLLDRVARRYLASGLCSICRGCKGPDGLDDPMASCKSAARSAAQQVNLGTRRRLDVLLGTLERLARSMAALAGRKSILVLSEGFPRDENMEARYRAVVDAAQRGNTSVYFTAARGLTGPSGYSVDSRAASAPGDRGGMSVEENLLAFAGAAQLAEATGGAVTRSNDLAAGLERIATDLSAYYLLGYQPEPSATGKWHKLEVKVDRLGVKVRARRGYRAGPPEIERVPATRSARRALQGVMAFSLAGGARDALPVRMALGLQEPDGSGGARVQVVVEVDGSRVRLSPTPAGTKAVLDLTILAVARDRPTVLPLHETIEMGLKSQEAAGWWAFFREVRLPPGVAQVRTTIQDKGEEGASTGTVAARIEIPDVEAPYLSTPLLTDRTQPPLAPGEPPRLVPTALRRFPRGRTLHLQYEVFGFGGRDMPGTAQVAGGYTLEAADGRPAAVVPPTLIGTDGKRVVRRISLPTAGLAPGAYEVRVDVEDRLARRSFSGGAAFVVEEGPERAP